MGGHPFDRANWFIAIIVIPICAICAFIWATLRDPQQRIASLLAYIAMIATTAIWLALTRF